MSRPRALLRWWNHLLVWVLWSLLLRLRRWRMWTPRLLRGRGKAKALRMSICGRTWVGPHAMARCTSQNPTPAPSSTAMSLKDCATSFKKTKKSRSSSVRWSLTSRTGLWMLWNRRCRRGFERMSNQQFEDWCFECWEKALNQKKHTFPSKSSLQGPLTLFK